ncbi:MAG: 4Fe-4S dicluster domain-containing protein [Phycisphaerales bacterium]|nr:MAG: 4Fe-4S dicluster domain-containing protein [Phycisphaerales bacterium]
MVILPKESLPEFIGHLCPFGELHVPVKVSEKSYAFGRVNDLSDIELNYTRTILPLKKYVFKPVDVMFNFCAATGYETTVEETDAKRVIFGVHPCDIHGLKILDLVFGGKYVDGYYSARRNKAAIVGMDCIPDEFCFCRSTGTDFVDTGFDLFLSDIGASYLVRVGTSLGDDMIRAADSLLREVQEQDRQAYKRRSTQRRESFQTEVQLQELPEIMDLEYDSEVWRRVGDKCLSCGTCSMVCPTCYCYAVFDELDLAGGSGRRQRRWDSCLFKDYALVAGGHNFRPDRDSRIKNRYFHKQRGFVSQHGRPSCVGCGRCKVYCLVGIDIVEVIKELRSEIRV